MSKNILILGGAGYLGDHLAALLSESNLIATYRNNSTDIKYDIYIYDSLLFEKEYLRPYVNFIYGDIRDKQKLLPYLKKADIVINLAAHVGDMACTINPEISYDVNVECLKWIRDNFDGLLIWPSSCSVYGTNDKIVDENAAVNPLSLYAETKVLGEDILNKSNKKNLILRLGTLYGLSGIHCRQRFDLVGNVLPCKAFFDKKITVFGGEQFRPIVNVFEIAKLIWQYIENDCDYIGTYNLGGFNTTLKELALIVKNFASNAEIIETNIPTEDLRNYKVSSDKAIKELGYQPTNNYAQHVDILLYILSSGRIVDWKNPIYHNGNWFKLKKPYLKNGTINEFPYDSSIIEKMKNLKLTSVI